MIFATHTQDNVGASSTAEFQESSTHMVLFVILNWRLRAHVCLVKSEGHDGIVYTSQTDLLSGF